MILFVKELYREMELELQAIAMSAEHEAFKARLSLEVVEQTLEKLKAYINGYSFKGTEEEITFFKIEKPKFQQLLVFYGEMIFIETDRPVGDKKKQVSYLRKAIRHNNRYIAQHKAIHAYYQQGHTADDAALFLRNPEQASALSEYVVDLDRTFATKASTVLAQLLAFEKVNHHLTNEIQRLERPAEVLNAAKGARKVKVVWTDSKAAMVELAYALKAMGVANHGKADINQYIQALANAFNLPLGNYYRTFVDLSNRKKARTPFLNSLKEHLERWMDARL